MKWNYERTVSVVAVCVLFFAVFVIIIMIIIVQEFIVRAFQKCPDGHTKIMEEKAVNTEYWKFFRHFRKCFQSVIPYGTSTVVLIVFCQCTYCCLETSYLMILRVVIMQTNLSYQPRQLNQAFCESVISKIIAEKVVAWQYLELKYLILIWLLNYRSLSILK